MQRSRWVQGFTVLSLAVASTLVYGASQRTFVASTGNDANACTLTQPCRSFARAISQTLGEGEVIVLDSAGYGAVTINQSVSITAPAGIYAGIAISSGVAVDIDAPGAIVVLRGLTIHGPSGYGVRVTDAETVRIESCSISRMFDGILTKKGVLHVQDSILRDNASTGINASPQTADVGATIANTVIADNGTGINAFAAAGTSVRVTVSHSTISGNTWGLAAYALPSGLASILSNGNTVVGSSVGFAFVGAGGTEIIYTRGDNTIGYNGTNVKDGSLTPCCAI